MDGALFYYVYRWIAGGTFSKINVSGTAYTDTGLAAETYRYTVSAVNTNEEVSDWRVINETKVNGRLSAPTGLTAVVSGNSVILSWNSVGGARMYWGRTQRQRG